MQMAQDALRTLIIESFKKHFDNLSPDVLSVAPGRVNLLGEHIDYNGYSVFPAAISRFTTVAAKIAESKKGAGETQQSFFFLRICHSSGDEKAYPAATFATLSDVVKHDFKAHSWSNYVVAAFVGLVDHLVFGGEQEREKTKQKRTVDESDELRRFCATRCLMICVGGDLPQAAGLSSSSSLVVASTLVFLALLSPAASTVFNTGVVQRLYPRANASAAADATSLLSLLESLESLEARAYLAQLCANTERLVGTAGGGMDQAAILLAKAGHAVRIDFGATGSVTATPKRLPANTLFLVVQSLVVSAKAEDSCLRYNKRWFECRISTRIMRNALQQQQQQRREKKNNGDTTSNAAVNPVTDTFKNVADEFGLTLEAAAEVAKSLLKPEPYTRDEIVSALAGEKRKAPKKEGEIEDEGMNIVNALLDGRCGRAVWNDPRNKSFSLLDRAVHVFSEAGRVDAATSSLVSSETFAQLMNNSGSSCDVLYDCSCPELREICKICVENGAAAARLTGAGWGGAVVAQISDANRVGDVIAALKKDYFVKRNLWCEERKDELMMIFEPAGPATVFVL